MDFVKNSFSSANKRGLFTEKFSKDKSTTIFKRNNFPRTSKGGFTTDNFFQGLACVDVLGQFSQPWC